MIAFLYIQLIKRYSSLLYKKFQGHDAVCSDTKTTRLISVYATRRSRRPCVGSAPDSLRGVLLFLRPFALVTAFNFLLAILERVGAVSQLALYFGFVGERTTGSLTLVLTLAMFNPALVVRRIGFRKLSRLGRFEGALRP